MAVDKKLKSIRDEIDSIDEEILSLINERAKFAMQAGEAKGDAVIYKPDRESSIFSRLNENTFVTVYLNYFNRKFWFFSR